MDRHLHLTRHHSASASTVGSFGDQNEFRAAVAVVAAEAAAAAVVALVAATATAATATAAAVEAWATGAGAEVAVWWRKR